MDTPPSPPERRSGWFVSEGWRWLVVTVLIPLVGFGWDRLQERQLKREKELDRERSAQQFVFEDRRNQSELVIKLLPALSGDPGSSQRSVALAVLSDLAQRGAGGDSLFAAVNLAVQESDRRVRDGQASDTERATLTHIAMARDDVMRPAATSPAPPPTGVDGGKPAKTPTESPAAKSTETPPPRPIVAPTRDFAISTPRLYVQVFDDSQVAEADKLRRAYASERRWLTPQVENVVNTATARGVAPPSGSKNTRVVYFNAEDEPRAATVVDWLRKNGQPDAVAQKSRLKAPSGQIEVWYPKE